MSSVDLACSLLVAFHAWQRFSTPSSNRSSTRQSLYWSAGFGYVLSALLLFVLLSQVLQLESMRALLLHNLQPNEQRQTATFSAPLLATLILTTMLPQVPVLRQVDGWLLNCFLTMGSIPAEVKRLAEVLRPENLEVTPRDLERLRSLIDAETFLPEGLKEHLRADRPEEGIGASQYRLTCVLRLYAAIDELRTQRAYARFFSERAEEFERLQQDLADFAARSNAGLGFFARLRAEQGGAIYEEIARDRREEYRKASRAMFQTLALFLARAVLRSQSAPPQLTEALSRAGFRGEPPLAVDFPVHSLAGLALLLLVLMLAADVLLRTFVVSDASEGRRPYAPFLVALGHTLAVGLTVFLMQRYSWFRRRPGGERPYLAYVLSGLAGGVAAGALAALFIALDTRTLPIDLSKHRIFSPLVVLSAALSFAIAYCCDTSTPATRTAALRRSVDAALCSVATALAAVLLIHVLPDVSPAQRAPEDRKALVLLSIVALVATVGGLFDAFVPHMVRTARAAARSRRDSDEESVAPSAQALRPGPAE